MSAGNEVSRCSKGVDPQTLIIDQRLLTTQKVLIQEKQPNLSKNSKLCGFVAFNSL